MNEFLFAVLPYIALTLFLAVPVIRRIRGGFTFTTRASGFIERQSMGIAALCFHWGIITLFAAHLLGLIGSLVASGSNLIDLFHWIGLIAGIFVIYGFALALIRRIVVPEMRAMSQTDDYVVLILLITIACCGIYPVIADKSFGLSGVVGPWVKSLYWTFSPDTAGMSGLPVLSKVHISAALLLFAYFPFTKLVHMWTYPFNYFVRPFQSMRTYKRVMS
ncbi:MAG: respiratory nitrate reductase subunit gamma [Actinobacteria bacterium]|nr:respiratory nitrate reductase subunit gamma [Actinomycetota bacterium]